MALAWQWMFVSSTYNSVFTHSKKIPKQQTGFGRREILSEYRLGTRLANLAIGRYKNGKVLFTFIITAVVGVAYEIY